MPALTEMQGHALCCASRQSLHVALLACLLAIGGCPWDKALCAVHVLQGRPFVAEKAVTWSMPAAAAAAVSSGIVEAEALGEVDCLGRLRVQALEVSRTAAQGTLPRVRLCL